MVGIVVVVVVGSWRTIQLSAHGYRRVFAGGHDSMQWPSGVAGSPMIIARLIAYGLLRSRVRGLTSFGRSARACEVVRDVGQRAGCGGRGGAIA